eukprot:scaffold301475_cov28-Prasinocladus_malaysianus.AAC.1
MAAYNSVHSGQHSHTFLGVLKDCNTLSIVRVRAVTQGELKFAISMIAKLLIRFTLGMHENPLQTLIKMSVQAKRCFLVVDTT